MRCPMNKAVLQVCIVSAVKFRISDTEKEDYKDGIIFEKVLELLTRGHVLNKERINKIEERSKYIDYVVFPTKY